MSRSARWRTVASGTCSSRPIWAYGRRPSSWRHLMIALSRSSRTGRRPDCWIVRTAMRRRVLRVAWFGQLSARIGVISCGFRSLRRSRASRSAGQSVAPRRLWRRRASSSNPARMATAALRSLRASHQISTRSAPRSSNAKSAMRRVASVAKPCPGHARSDPVADLEPRHLPVDCGPGRLIRRTSHPRAGTGGGAGPCAPGSPPAPPARWPRRRRRTVRHPPMASMGEARQSTRRSPRGHRRRRLGVAPE